MYEDVSDEVMCPLVAELEYNIRATMNAGHAAIAYA